MYMLDSSTPPTDAALEQAAAAGIVAWAGYVSSPGHPVGWARADFDRVRRARLVPVYVDLGSSPGTIGSKLVALGAQPGDNVVTDIESGGATLQAAGAWRAAVAADGYRPWVYGSWATVNAAPAGFAVKWGAAYGQAPATVRPGEVVQFENTHTEFGMSVDRSAVGEGVFGMTAVERADLGAALARLAYAAVLHRDPVADPNGLAFWSGQFAAGFDHAAAAFIAAGEAQHDLADEQHEAAGIDAERA